MMQKQEPFQEATEDDLKPEEEPPITRKKKSKNKRRFSDEQVRSLETIFSSETKLEQKKKVQVARELGLQPRQVAIWFQNKRARWKSKQIEKNYKVLKANYDNLKARFESMRKEKESLLEQLQELHNLSEKSSIANSEHFDRENRDTDAGLPIKSSVLQEEVDHQATMYSDDDKSGNMAYLSKDEPDLMGIDENIDGSMISPVKWCGFDAGSFFDQSSTSSHWWDSWT